MGVPEETTGRIPLLGELLASKVARFGDRTALRHRVNGEWREISWRTLGADVRAAAKALVDLGVGEGDRVAIWSSNRPGWTIADLACIQIRAVSVPLHSTAPLSQAAYILNEAEVKVAFVGGAEQLARATALRPSVPTLAHLVVLDGSVPALGTLPQGGTPALGWEDFLAAGRNSPSGAEVEARLSRASHDDLLTLIYTSGTTGEPKGVMLTHGNFASTARYHDERLPNPGESDVSLCFLPLAHVFERAWSIYALLSCGMTVGYCDDPAKVAEFLQEVRPTVMCAVPRFYEKVYGMVLEKVSSASRLRRALFAWAVRAGSERARRTREGRPVPPWLSWKHAVADRLVLEKIRGITGGRARFFPCAGAPLSREIEEFFQACGVFVMCGYGLTETTATVSCHETTRFRPGTVGKPLSGVKVKISDDGEILVRGSTVMKGYYRKPKETEAVFVDGWFRTGDAGLLDADGNLLITERIKDLIKTSGGKYVAPQQIESTIGADLFVDQIAVVGEGRKFVTALIVPAFDTLEKWARSAHIQFSERAELIRNPKVVELFRERILKRSEEFAPFERIIRFTLLPEALSIERGEMTPTMKVRRREAIERYRDLVELMYSEG
jgi:long-chain acyl-CoA synthetase